MTILRVLYISLLFSQCFLTQIHRLIVKKDQTIPTDAEPPDTIIEVCYLNTTGNILEDDYRQVISEDENDDISEEENDSPELTDDAHARQLIETFCSSSQMQKVVDEQGLSPRGTILLSPGSGTGPPATRTRKMRKLKLPYD
uniref:Uncharacterized protein n=1 Tax=Solanum tuberosum TaxID=4113 RepID=M1DN26_SOLTU